MAADTPGAVPTMGRPFKGRHKRVQITIYVDILRLDVIDKLVEEKRTAGDRSASRSEEYDLAIQAHLEHLGRS